MKQQYLWLAVAADKYELPLVVEDSSARLGEKYGLGKKTVASLVHKHASGTRNGYRYLKVRIDEGDIDRNGADSAWTV